MMVRPTAQMGNFMNMVISGKWWKIKKRYMSLSMDRGYKVKKKRELHNVVVRPRNKN
jgi:hypothetical protein